MKQNNIQHNTINQTNKNKKNILFTLILTLLSLPFHDTAYAQKVSSIGGIVRDKDTKEPLIGATIMIEGTKQGTRTNKSGFYSILNVPLGEYYIIARYMGYKQFKQKVRLTSNRELRFEIEMEATTISTEAVEVIAEKEDVRREITISKVNVPVHQIKEIRVGGESDLFRTLQFLPGVLTSSQISSGLYVRGGSPDQNLVMLDGATVYNPSHLFGFFSTFNTNAIKDVEFEKGGFGAEYGGRLSSVLNVTQKDGNRKEISGDLSIGLISSQAGIEAPLGNGSFFVSGRRTYFDFILPLVEGVSDDPIPDFYFYDINLKLTQNFGDNDKVSITGFLGRDVLNFAGSSNDIIMNLGNDLLSGQWTHIFSNTLFASLVVNYSRYQNNFAGGESGYAFLFRNSIEDFTGKANFEWFIKENAAVKFGAEVNSLTFNFLQNFTGDTVTTSSTAPFELNMEIPDLNYAAYVQSKFNLTEYFSVQAGLRASYFKLSESFLLDPRFSVRYMLTGDVALKAAWGIYHQGLRIAGMPEFNLFDCWVPSDSSVPVSKSNHYIVSVETKLGSFGDLNFDAYYKTMNGVSELNQISIVGGGNGTIEAVSNILFVGNAYSYGGEVFLQKTSGRLTGWLGYGLGFIYAQFDSINGGTEFRPKYDRRHDFKAVVQYKLFENWEIGGTFTLQSGQSYTGATSRGKIFMGDQTLGNTKITNSQRYGLRLPVSHQLNLYGAYSFKLFGFNARCVVDIFNVYNRRDIMMRMYNTSSDLTVVEDMRLLPIIPSISLEVKF